MPSVTVNGEERELPDGSTVAELIARVAGPGAGERGLIAVELNREILARERHGATRLSNGDRVEIVTFVGGG